MSSDSLHEPADSLRPETVDVHRAIASLMEELEAVDWYNQRVDACVDPDLAGILAHNRDEEKEHAAMVLEWLRRHDTPLDDVLRQYLFSRASVVELEGATSIEPASPDGGSLGIGSLKDKEQL